MAGGIKFKDVAHLYLGALVRKKSDQTLMEIVGIKRGVLLLADDIDGTGYNRLLWPGEYIPVLRRLQDMKPEEAVGVLRFCPGYRDAIIEQVKVSFRFGISFRVRYSPKGRWFVQQFSLASFSPVQVHYLLSRHFDLFGLIEAGEAIDVNAKTEPA